MTKEEAIKLIDDRMCFGRGKWSEHHRPVIDEYWQAGEMAIKALEVEPHWIPVEQALPKIGEYVFCETATGCFGKYCKHHVCKFVDKDKWIDRPHFDWDRNGFPHVIAWMPLPESFKGVTE